MTIRRTRIACRVPNATHTLTTYNIHCFSTATMVTRKRPNITSVRTLPVLLFTFIHKFIIVKVLSTLPIALTIYIEGGPKVGIQYIVYTILYTYFWPILYFILTNFMMYVKE